MATFPGGGLIPAFNMTLPADTLENRDTIVLPKTTCHTMGTPPPCTVTMTLAFKTTDVGRVGQIFTNGMKMPMANSSGGWIAHCHFLEHADQGMMTFVTVVP